MLQYFPINDLATEPVTLADAKEFMQVDYSDFDDLITDLIKMARQASEQVTGLAYSEKTIQVTGNTEDERIYPIRPVPVDSEVTWADESTDGTTDYRYKAGYGISGETQTLPEPLRLAILKRVATAFAYRENVMEAMTIASNASQSIEMQFRQVFFV